MRVVEITSAEEQLALWRLISDSVWQSIAVQKKQEATAQAKKTRIAKAKRPTRVSSANTPKPIAALQPPTSVGQSAFSAQIQQPKRSNGPFDAQSASSSALNK